MGALRSHSVRMYASPAHSQLSEVSGTVFTSRPLSPDVSFFLNSCRAVEMSAKSPVRCNMVFRKSGDQGISCCSPKIEVPSGDESANACVVRERNCLSAFWLQAPFLNDLP